MCIEWMFNVIQPCTVCGRPTVNAELQDNPRCSLHYNIGDVMGPKQWISGDNQGQDVPHYGPTDSQIARDLKNKAINEQRYNNPSNKLKLDDPNTHGKPSKQQHGFGW